MNKICLLIALTLSFLFAFSQKVKPKAGTQAATLFSFFPNNIVTFLRAPHLDSLISKAYSEREKTSKIAGDYEFNNPIKLSDSVVNKLTSKEKFVYAFKYPEQYTQICSIYESYDGSSPFLQSSLPYKMSGYVISGRQYKILANARNSVILNLNDVIKIPGNIGNDYKQAIVYLKLFECVPALIHKYATSKTKDNFILTTGILLMKNDNFPDFINSNIYKKLYGQNAFSREKMDLTEPVKTTTIDLINKYYKWKTGK